MIKEAIIKIVDKQDLTYDEAYAVMNEVMSGKTSPTQNAAFLAALSTKSTKAETIDEIAGCAAAMREHALKVEHDMDVLEIVGTGGDNAHSFNISTTSALVIAAGGAKAPPACYISFSFLFTVLPVPDSFPREQLPLHSLLFQADFSCSSC